MDDSINRHGVSAWLYNLGYPKLADIVMNEQRFPSAQQEQRWIPCSERMPDPFVEVLVSDVDGDVRIAYFENLFSAWWSDRYGRIEVLAWMPLPEPYREEE